MILKIIHFWGKVTESFISDFDYINVIKNTDNQQIAIDEPIPATKYCWGESDTSTTTIIEICSKDNIIKRKLYISKTCPVYLMSNEGKTIERLN